MADVIKATTYTCVVLVARARKIILRRAFATEEAARKSAAKRANAAVDIAIKPIVEIQSARAALAPARVTVKIVVATFAKTVYARKNTWKMANAVPVANVLMAFAWKQFPARTTQHAILVNAAARAMNSTAKTREFIAHVHLNVVVNIVKSHCAEERRVEIANDVKITSVFPMF